LPRRRLRRRRRGVPLDGEAGASQGRGGQEKRAGLGVRDGFLPMANIGSGEIIFRPGRNRRGATEYFAALRTIWNPPGFRRGSVETGKAESSYRAGGVGAPAAAGRSGRRAAFGRGRSRAVRAGAFASAPARDRGGLLHRRVLLAAGAGAGR